jgi:hypothetical protein
MRHFYNKLRRYCKTFYGRNLQISVIKLEFWGWGRSLPEWSTFQMLHSRLDPWSYPQMLD